tara:strand:+ start:443 stop:604 length:162 start_codon:yes stop_codon:yes gene_type:complete
LFFLQWLKSLGKPKDEILKVPISIFFVRELAARLPTGTPMGERPVSTARNGLG